VLSGGFKRDYEWEFKNANYGNRMNPDDRQDFTYALVPNSSGGVTEERINKNEILKRLENEDLKTPIHVHELKFSTIEGDVFVTAEPESVNSVTFHHDPETIDSVSLVAHCFYDKGGKFLARSLTKLPVYRMIDLLMCLVFSP